MTRIATVAAVIAMLMVLTSTANAAWYAKFDGVDGSSTAKDHAEWCNVVSVSIGVDHKPAQGPGTIMMTTSDAKALPKLQEAAVKGKVFNSVIFSLTGDGDSTPYLQWKLQKVIVTSYSVNGSGLGELTLAYRSLGQVDPDGPGRTIVPQSLTSGDDDSDGSAETPRR